MSKLAKIKGVTDVVIGAEPFLPSSQVCQGIVLGAEPRL